MYTDEWIIGNWFTYVSKLPMKEQSIVKNTPGPSGVTTYLYSTS